MSRATIALLVIGALLLLLGLLLTLFAGAVTMPSYLADWLFWSALPLGALPVIMLLDLAGPGAGFGLEQVFRRLLLLLPVAALLIIPILVRPGDLFGWARGHGFSAPFGKAWMGYGPFVGRNVAYFVIWVILGLIFVRPPRLEHIGRRRAIAACGLFIYALCMTLASTDWAVTVEPDWISPEYPLLLASGQAVIAISVALLLAGDPWRRRAAEPAAAFLQTAVAAWIFTQFIQFLVIWSADKESDISWYLHRWHLGTTVAVLIAFVFGFVVPLVVLFAPRLRRRPLTLPAIAVLSLCIQALSMLWLITPSLRHHFTVTGMDVLEFFAIGGVTLGVCLWTMADLKVAYNG